MKVLVIGAGNMGAGFVKQFAAAGHQVTVTARDAAKAQALANQYGAEAVPSAGAANDRDVIVVATGFADAVTALQGVGDLAGKTVVDITNPLSADFMSLTVGHTTSAAETIAAAIPAAHVVKAFNTVFAQVLAAGPELSGQKVPVLVASDDKTAKEAVKALAQSVGFDVIDTGGLSNARYLEPLAGLNIYLGYGAGLGTSIAPTWIRNS
ncbi:NAD(P)-binding domain-containing protein [Variovorax robiniae]|uniref:NAD(P)-binding domain-containing protein n=1 Tax=Variovorax robiniae TaxID=1836199 RepID=A0ABU8XJC1_9BURK